MQRIPHLFVPLLAISTLGCAQLQDRLSDKVGKSPSAQSADVRIKDLNTRDAEVRKGLETASTAYREGKPSDAALAYNEVLSLDPLNQRAQAGLKKIEADARHAEWLGKAQEKLDHKDEMGAEKLLRQILVENPDHAEALSLLAPLVAKVDEKRSNTPVLKSASRNPVTMEFRDGEVKAVFEALSKATGLNFILDKDIRPDQKVSVFLKNAVMEDAIDGLLAANQLQKKVLNETTMVVYPNFPQKAKEYQDLVVRSYYISNGDVTKVQTLLKSMLQLKDIYVDEKLGLIVLKDSPDVLKLADKLIQLQDRPDPEVVLEVEVLEVEKSKLTDLGITYPNQLSVIGTSATTSTLRDLKHITDNRTGLSPLPSIKFSQTDKDINLLANPRIRVRNKEKAKIHVGNRIPIITTIFNSTGTSSSETVQYIDDGLKLDVEPSVNYDDEVTIRVNLEVSTAAFSEGAKAPTIGTRSAGTLLRLKDGETQILAGLINDNDIKDASRVPGLGSLPILGRLFSKESNNRKKTDIVLSITPHVIRNVAPLSVDVGQFWLGPESAIGRPQTNISIPGFLQPMIRPAAPAATPAPAAAPAAAAPPATPSQPTSVLPGGLILTPNGLQQSR